jgi:O-antigen/teichoic acid export membrane protein
MIEDLETPSIAEVGGEPPGAAVSFVRTAFGHGALYALGGALSQAIGLLLFPFFAQVLSPHDYGIIDLVALAGTFVGVTIALEISQGLGRYFLETRDPEERRTLASTALVFTLVTYSVGAIAALLLVDPLTALLFGQGVKPSLTAVAIVGMWAGGILYLTQFLLQIQLRPVAYGIVTLVTTGAGAATSVFLVFGLKTGVIGVLIGQVVGCSAGAAVAFGLSRSLCGLRFDTERLKRMLAYSIPLIPGSAGVFLNAYADRIAIRTHLGISEVGVYGAGYRLALIVSLVLLGLQGALSPLVLAHHTEQQTRRELARLFRLFSAIALAVFLVMSLFAIELLHVLTRPAYYPGATIVPFVIAASFFGGMYVFAPGLNIAKRTGLFGLVFGLTGGVNLLLAFLLVRGLGIRGPALAFLIACAGGFVTLMALSQRVYPVPHDWRRLLPRAIAVGGLVAAASAVLGEAVSAEYFLIKLMLVAVGLAIIGGLVDRTELLGLVRLLRASGQSLRRTRRETRQRRHANSA